MKKQTSIYIILVLCMALVAQACIHINIDGGHKGRYSAKYTANGENIDLLNYTRMGKRHIVLTNYNKNYLINYPFSYPGNIWIMNNNWQQQPPDIGHFEPIVDTTGGFYNTGNKWDHQIWPADSMGEVKTVILEDKYPIDSLKGAERIYISPLEIDLLNDAIMHIGNEYDKPMDCHRILFFIRVPRRLHVK